MSANELTKDSVILLDAVPHRVLDVKHKKVARQATVAEVKFKNLINGATIIRTINPSTDKFEEANIEKKLLQFVYFHRDKYVFSNPLNKSERYELAEDKLEDEKIFLKPSLEITAHFLKDEIISIELPIKVEYKVVEAPPNMRGNTVSGGTKQVIIESGATISTPLFIEAGDVIRVNTQKGEYAERVKKAY